MRDYEENNYNTNSRTSQMRGSISNESTNGDTIILLVVVWMFISRIFWFLIPKFFDQYFSQGWFEPVNALMTFIWGLIPIGLAFAIKDKSKQGVLFVLGGIYLLYSVFEIVTTFVKL